MRRRKTAVLLVLTALLAAGFLLWGNCSLQTTETALVSPALPPAFDGLRIVELADLHGRVFGRGSRRLLAAVRRAEPDLICIDGDLFDEHTDLAMLPPLLRGLCAIAPRVLCDGQSRMACARPARHSGADARLRRDGAAG